MIRTRRWGVASAILLPALMVAGAAAPSAGQPAAAATPAMRAGARATPETAALPASAEQDAQETRRQLETLFEQYPPSLREVLRLDPSLLTKQDYLAPYPALVAFLAQHPEVARSPAFFVGEARVASEHDTRNRAIDLWEGVLAGVAAFLAFLTLTGVLVWLIRTLVDYRRWLRLSKVQTEAHSKLLDRFTSNEDLLAYVQTPAGRRFLESAPIPIDMGPRAVSAPLGRILWSVQAGLVLALGGLGLQYVKSRVVPEAAEPLFAVGVLAFALGTGFVLSAIVAYALSRHLGLFELRPPASPSGRDAPGLSS